MWKRYQRTLLAPNRAAQADARATVARLQPSSPARAAGHLNSTALARATAWGVGLDCISAPILTGKGKAIPPPTDREKTRCNRYRHDT